ncbi:low molecular weight protein-tyrosine-phosphatase [Saccharicrinis aurantiacus]|uniref:low molecular weight protein-tyrosine-phosphatase n=1 Tax=Saccharicrinis aurantiacus TaxID=1849719 RepID=UPI000837C4F0|nr:low molecular weight protein-tyrosine-phosphatase [Saccharicrinis aurantiacus]
MDKTKILFVCLGNICRSPSAEAVMKAKLAEHKLSDKYYIDSAGITGYHEGDSADSRMMQHAKKRAYQLTSISRPVKAKDDFANFDFIIGMDDSNMTDLFNLAQTDADISKLSKMTDYSIKFSETNVPDPYYGGSQGFELVLDLLEDACEGLISQLEEHKKKGS